jgi:hypothetical protein
VAFCFIKHSSFRNSNNNEDMGAMKFLERNNTSGLSKLLVKRRLILSGASLQRN